MDNNTGAWCDPYLTMRFGKHSYKSQWVKYDKTAHKCDIDYVFKLPVQWPSSVDRLVLEVRDYDQDQMFRAGEDDTLGSIVLSIKDLVKKFSKLGGGLVWMNIYGSPTGNFETNVKKEMNHNPELASQWKGRILMHFEVFDTKNPEVISRKVDKDVYTLSLAA